MLHTDGGVLPVLNANPPGEVLLGKNGEDAVIVVQSATDDAVLKDRGVAGQGMGVDFLEVFKRCARRKISVAGVHGLDVLFDGQEQFDRVVTGNDCV